MTDLPPPDDRRTRILDAAEKLFAMHGFDGVTLRAIAREAGVDLALANYHFGRKRQLFDAVFLRRATFLNEARLADLAEVERAAAPGSPSVRDIMRAYLGPLLLRDGVEQPGWRSYYALVAYVNNSPVFGREMMGGSFNATIQTFIQALARALPDADPAALYWGYHCLTGALTLTFAQTGRLDDLSGGLARSTDLAAAYEGMVDFMTAGFERIGRRASHA